MLPHIATQSRARRLYTDYDEAVRLDKIAGQLARFCQIDGPIHKTLTITDARQIIADQTKEIAEYMQLLQEHAHELGLDSRVTRDIKHSNGVPFEPLPALVRSDQLPVEPSSNEVNAKVYRYSYIPIDLIIETCLLLLSKWHSNYGLMTRPDDMVRVSRVLQQTMRSIGNSASVRLLRYDLGYSNRADAIENDPKHHMHALIEGNAAMCATSDVALHFSELYFVTSNDDLSKSIIEASGLLDETQQQTFTGLLLRQQLRDEVTRVLAEKGSIVINGATYTPATHGGVMALVSDYPADTFTANLTGLPIYADSGVLVRPASWITLESRLVGRYIASPNAKNAQAILAHYIVAQDYSCDDELAKLLVG